VSGHQHNPFCAVTVGPPSETNGEVKGFSLLYSGNFSLEAELSDFGRLRINFGIHPMGLRWRLRRGECFNTPEVALVRSSEGMGGMSRVFHRLFLDKLIPRIAWAETNPPVLLNSWEAKYFSVSHANIVEMAEHASSMGIDLIVLDDGWMCGREDCLTSLGDWSPHPVKFPLGLKGLVDAVNAQGVSFGLWVEPEMVSEDSNLYRAHPDWLLRVPGRPRQIGRNQMVLDFSREDVRNYLFDKLADLLSSANIVQSHTHTHIYIYVHTHVEAKTMRACAKAISSNSTKNTHKKTQTFTHTTNLIDCIHTCTQSHKKAHIHTHTHTHTYTNRST